jgi:hypothetical protein
MVVVLISDQPKQHFSLHQQFLRLHLLASALMDNHNNSDPGKQSAEKLKQHLDKVNQYFHSIPEVITATKKWFPDGQIPHLWFLLGRAKETTNFVVTTWMQCSVHLGSPCIVLYH